MRRVAVDAANLVLPVEGIRAIEVSWTGSMAGEAAFVYHLRGCVFRIEVKNELLRLGIFCVGALRLHFSIGVGFARTVAPITTGARARSGCPLRDLIIRARVDGFRNLFTRLLVTMKASLSSCQRARIGLSGSSLPGNGRGHSRSWLLLGENNCSSCEKPDEKNYKEPERLGLQAFLHPQPLFVRAAYCPERRHLLLTALRLNPLREMSL